MQQFETILTQEQVNRRAGGRRHYNSIRAFKRSLRRMEIIRWWQDNGGLTDWGTQRRLAAKWAVSPATICRDVSAILQTGLLCEKCGQSRPIVGQ
jgi:hypothetical protein